MRKFTYLVPKNLNEAISMHESYDGRAKYIAGGTDVLVKLKEGKLSPDYLVSLKHIIGQDRPFLDEGSGELFIGAFMTHRSIERSPLVQRRYPILHDAVKNIGSVQIRNVATIGGNLVNAVPSADGAIPLIALDAKARIYGPKGERLVELGRFFLGPGQCDLQGAEILTEIIVPDCAPRSRQTRPPRGHGAADAGGRGSAQPRAGYGHLRQGAHLPGGGRADPLPGAGCRAVPERQIGLRANARGGRTDCRRRVKGSRQHPGGGLVPPGDGGSAGEAHGDAGPRQGQNEPRLTSSSPGGVEHRASRIASVGLRWMLLTSKRGSLWRRKSPSRSTETR